MRCAVIDVGSHMSRSGFAGDDHPTSVIPTVIGKYKGDDKFIYVGDEACWGKRGAMIQHFPVHGAFGDIDSMELIWKYILYNELRVQIDETPVMLTDFPATTHEIREEYTEILFESISIPSLCIMNQQLLSLYASGHETGLVVDCGHLETNIVPIFTSKMDKTHKITIELGGVRLTDYLAKLLKESGHNFANEIVCDIKKHHAYVETDPVSPEFKTVRYELPDGQLITLGDELSQIGKGLFDPSLMELDCQGIHDAIINYLKNHDDNQTILVTGGTSRLPGFKTRLEKEILPFNNLVIDTQSTLYPSWVGGSILASLSSAMEYFLTKDTFEEEGTNALHRFELASTQKSARK